MNRRIGYAEKEGLAVIRRQRAKQRRKDLIGAGIVIGAVLVFFSWAVYMFATGQTPIW